MPTTEKGRFKEAVDYVYLNVCSGNYFGNKSPLRICPAADRKASQENGRVLFCEIVLVLT